MIGCDHVEETPDPRISRLLEGLCPYCDVALERGVMDHHGYCPCCHVGLRATQRTPGRIEISFEFPWPPGPT